MKTNISITKRGWVPSLRGSFLPGGCDLTCRDLTNAVPALGTSPMAAAVAQELVPGATPALFWVLVSLGGSSFLPVPDFEARTPGNFPTSSKGKPGKWHGHSLRALGNAQVEGKGEGFCSRDPSPFLTSLFIKDF